ncbi:2-oxoglutarate dehydrogenase E1 [Cytobacillus sp. FJAT-54145]|uniref:2-oxoglutarate dehydrogenase E1 n=1 Tax=Cytobacillus spartinae TaxID=3299023 RepID=A0ABW6KKW6_9BACI
MKALSMIQPWSSLFILGEAHYETRTWRTNYRGIFAIHASKKIDKTAISNERINTLLYKYGYIQENLPTGMIIGTCKLMNCLRVLEDNQSSAILEDGRVVSGNDYFLGDFRVGNYAWEVKEKTLLNTLIPAKGKLGLWEHSI